MAIQNTARTATFTSTGSTGPYTFTFAYNDDEDLKLTIDGVLSTAFAITPGAGEGGTFYTNSITASGAELIFYRETPRTQGQTFSPNTTPRASAVASAVDKLTMVIQEQDAAIADYRNSLRLEPSLQSSKDGLKRLGAEE